MLNKQPATESNKTKKIEFTNQTSPTNKEGGLVKRVFLISTTALLVIWILASFINPREAGELGGLYFGVIFLTLYAPLLLVSLASGILLLVKLAGRLLARLGAGEEPGQKIISYRWIWVFLGVGLVLGTWFSFTIMNRFKASQPVPSGVVTPSPDIANNWKTFTLENISFKYPGGWGPPETFDSNFGLAGRIESTESEHVIRVLTGFNKGRTPEENEKFIEDFSLGGQKLTLDGSVASLHTLEYEGTKAITVYVLSKNKDSAYSISITSKADDENTENLFDQILSTFKFIEIVEENSVKLPLDWKKIDASGKFSFYIPPYLKKDDTSSGDSYTEGYSNENLKLSFDYGPFSDTLESYSQEKEYKEEYLIISGKLAKIVSFLRTDVNQYYGFPYVALVNFNTIVEHTDDRLTLHVLLKDKSDLETANKIFRSVAFPK